MRRGSAKKRSTVGTPMHTVGQKRRRPKWMLASYEERIAARDISSARRLARLEAKGKVQTLGTTITLHTCGQPTTLEPRYCEISGRRGHYASFCPRCQVFA